MALLSKKASPDQLDLFNTILAEPHVSRISSNHHKTAAEKNADIERLVASKTVFSGEEKEYISQYTGAGGLEKQGAAGAGLLDEYFTPKIVANKIWDLLQPHLPAGEHLKILEPAAGTGNFFENAPEGAELSFCEKNPTSSRILPALYPSAKLLHKHFEELFIGERGAKLAPKAEYDIVIGNPPFGSHRGVYKGLGEESKIGRYEQYFTKRALDVLKPGGLAAFVLPAGFLQGSKGYGKTAIAQSGELLAAWRLPVTVFETTSINVDVVIFRKNPVAELSPELESRIDLLCGDTYFLNNPEAIIGEEKERSGRYGKEKYIDGPLSAFLDVSEESFKIEKLQFDDEPVKETEFPQAAAGVDRHNVKQAGLVISNHKNDDVVTLSNEHISDEELEIWSHTTALGHLETSFMESVFNKQGVNDVNEFYHKSINVSFNNYGDAVFLNNFNYYQGDIYERLKLLEMNKDKLFVKQYERQLSGLNKILPEVVPFSRMKLGPHDVLTKDFMCADERTMAGEFDSYLRDLPEDMFADSSYYEIADYVEQRPVYGKDKIVNTAVRRRRRRIGDKLFQLFLQNELSEEDKRRLQGMYNESRNSIVPPDYSLPPLVAPVYSHFGDKKLVLRKSQIFGSGFLTNKGLGCLAHEVGGGKTLAAIIAVNEMLNRKWCKKPLIIVPRNIYPKWIVELTDVIPGIKINSLGNLGKAYEQQLKDFHIEDGSITIITQEGLNKLGFKPETYAELSHGLHDVMSSTSRITKRQAEAENARIDETTGKAKKGTKTEFLVEDFGFDAVVMDEAHRFKNIFSAAKMAKGKANEFAAIRGGNSSARGIKAYFLSQYILSKYNNRGVILLTATPFTNSPMEYYSMLSLLAKKRLEKLGFTNVNDFMTAFMELKSTFVVKADRTLQVEEVIEKFKNARQLTKLLYEFFDFRSGKELGLVRPDKLRKTISIKPTRKQIVYMGKAEELFADKDAGGAIVAITELQNITLSPYLSRYCDKPPADYKAFVEDSPKIHLTVQAIKKVHEDKPAAGQIFHMARGVDYHPFIKEYLVQECGFKDKEVAIVSGKINSSERAIEKIRDGFNAGQIKVLIGSDTIKEGIDLQATTTDVYSVHLPWNPLDLDQLEGRAWRFGNKWKNVRISYPLIENSVDPFIFQKLETKEKRIKSARTADADTVEVNDIDFEAWKLDLITDPVLKVKAERILGKSEAVTELQTLKAEKALVESDYLRAKKFQEQKENYEEMAQTYSYRPEYVKRYTRFAETAAKKLDIVKEKLKKTDMNEVKKKISVFDEKIKTCEDKLDNEQLLFKQKLAAAEEIKKKYIAEPTVAENNFAPILEQIQQENKKILILRDPAAEKKVDKSLSL